MSTSRILRRRNFLKRKNCTRHLRGYPEIFAGSRARPAFRRDAKSAALASPGASSFSYCPRNAIPKTALECHHRSLFDSRRGFNSTAIDRPRRIRSLDRSDTRETRGIIDVRCHSFPAKQFSSNCAVCRALFANRALSGRARVAVAHAHRHCYRRRFCFAHASI